MRVLEGTTGRRLRPAVALIALLLGRDALAQEASPDPPALAHTTRGATAPALVTIRRPAASGPPAAASRRRDPLAVEGAAILLAGGALAGVAAVVLATGSGTEACGLTGCFERRENHHRKVGTAMAGGSVGAALIGAPVLVAGLVGPVPRDSDRMSEPMMLTGVAVTASANALIGLGVGYMVADPTDTAETVAVGLFVLAGAMLATSIPLWTRGVARVKPDTGDARPHADRHPDVLIGPAAASLRWSF